MSKFPLHFPFSRVSIAAAGKVLLQLIAAFPAKSSDD